MRPEDETELEMAADNDDDEDELLLFEFVDKATGIAPAPFAAIEGMAASSEADE